MGPGLDPDFSREINAFHHLTDRGFPISDSLAIVNPKQSSGSHLRCGDEPWFGKRGLAQFRNSYHALLGPTGEPVGAAPEAERGTR
jgi:hypothetical protein